MNPSRLAFFLAFALIVPQLANGDTIYVSRYQLPAIDRVDASGNVSPFVSGFPAPAAMALDSHGNLFVATQGNLIYKIDPLGTVGLFASTGLSTPDALAFDAFGNLFVANEGNNSIEKFDSLGHGTFFANTGPIQPSGGMAFDNNGNLYVAREGNYTIEKFDSQGNGSLFASVAAPYAMTFYSGILYVGSGVGGIYKLDAYGNQTLFATAGASSPAGLAFDSSGRLYCANYNGTITRYNSQGNSSLFATDNYLNGIVIQAVPEPAAWFMGSVGGILLLALSRRR
jgi:hypothetical protein